MKFIKVLIVILASQGLALQTIIVSSPLWVVSVFAQDASNSATPTVSEGPTPTFTPTPIEKPSLPTPTPTLSDLSNPSDLSDLETPTPTPTTQISPIVPTPSLSDLSNLEIPTPTPTTPVLPSPTEILTKLKDILLSSPSAQIESTPSATPEPSFTDFTGISGLSARIRRPINVRPLSKKDLKASDKITLKVDNTDGNEVLVNLYNAQNEKVEVNLEKEVAENGMIVKIYPPRTLKPGKYTVKVNDQTGKTEEETVNWGNLVLNINKNVFSPQEKVKLALSFLDSDGKAICSGDLTLKVQSEKADFDEELSTENAKITKNPDCSNPQKTNKPDYETAFQTKGPGTYVLTLTSQSPLPRALARGQSSQSPQSISDFIEVKENEPLIIERKAPARVSPNQDYPVTLDITANTDFKGQVVETVPDSFEVKPQEKTINFNNQETVSESQNDNILGAQTSSIRPPFDASFIKTLGFGEQSNNPKVEKEYKSLGLLGHDGLDFDIPIGTQIKAVAEGNVELARSSDYGETVVISHSWGKSFYGHLSTIYAKEGQKISKGEVLGLSGESGFTTGPHLHFGLKPEKADLNNGFYGKIDPAPFLDTSLAANLKVKKLTWEVDLKKGEKITLGYNFTASSQNGESHLLGPLVILAIRQQTKRPESTGSSSSLNDLSNLSDPSDLGDLEALFSDSRPWQIYSETADNKKIGKILGKMTQKAKKFAIFAKDNKKLHVNGFETPEFEFDLKDEKFNSLLNDSPDKQKGKVKATVKHKEREGELSVDVMFDNNNRKLTLLPKLGNDFKPGLYELNLTINTPDGEVNIKQDFTWGVLAVNFNKTVYSPGDKAHLMYAILDSAGTPICGNYLETYITDPDGNVTFLSTDDKTINLNPGCSDLSPNAPPDYDAFFQTKKEGTYKVKVHATPFREEDTEGYTITDQFLVDPNVTFDVEREGPTRIYPSNAYTMKINITPEKDFNGTVIEKTPVSFDNKNLSDNGRVVEKEEEIELIWDLNLKKGQKKTISYEFKAPEVSPEFYLLGPLVLSSKSSVQSSENIVFSESRQWQIASDAITNTTCNWDGSSSNAWSTAANWSCNAVPSNTCSGNSGTCYWVGINDTTNNPVLLGSTARTISGLIIGSTTGSTSMTIDQTAGTLTIANIGTAPSGWTKGAVKVGSATTTGTLNLNPAGAATCLTTNESAAVTVNNANGTITSSNSNCTWDHNTNVIITNAGTMSGLWSMKLAGGFTNTGTLNMTNGTFTTDTNTPTIACSNATRSNNKMNNLTVNVNTTLSGSCKFGAAVTITTGDTLTTGTGTHESTTTGTAISNSGTFTASTGNTWIISGSGTVGSGSLTGTNDFVNLTIDGTNITANAGVSFDVSATLTIGTASDGNNDTFDIGSGLSVTSTSIGTVTLQTNGAGDTNSITGSGRLVITNSNLSANGTISSIVRFDGVSSSAVTVPARTYGSDVELYDAASTTQRNFNTGSGTVSITGNVYLIANSITAAGDVNFSSFTNGTVVTISGATGIDYTGTGAADELITLGSGTWTVAGSVDFTGGTLASTNGGTFDLSGTTKTLTSASQSFRDLKISGSVTAQDAVIASRELQVTGTFTLGANNLTVGLTSSTSPGYIKVPSGGTITQASGTTVIQNGASGTSCIGGNSDNSCTGTVGTIGFYNLDIGNASSATVTTINGTSPAITVDNVLTVTTSATLNAGSSTITLTGKGITPLVRNGTFTSSSSTVKYTGASGAPWWSTNYAYRKQITVSATDAVTSGYSTSLTFDHATLYSSSKSLISGDDVRIVYYNVSSTELDRVLDDSSSWNNAATKIWFKLQANISASSTDSNYYMYYNYPSAASPPVNKSNVYAFWDDFDNANYTDNWTAGTGTWTEGTTCGGPANCVYVSSGTSGDLYTTSFTLDNGEWSTSMKRTSSFAARLDAESYIVNTSNFAAVSLHGNGSLYQSLNRSGSNLLTNPCTSWTADTSYHTIVIKKRTNYWSWSMDGTTKCTETPTFTPLNTSLEVGGDGTPYYDWVKARKLVATEPSTSLGTEASQTTTLTSTTITFYNLTINGSGVTFNLGAATTVSNDLTITAGTLDVTTTNHALNVAHDWSNSGSFTARNGTVTLNGAGGSTQTITGSTTFYALAATATTARTLAFQATATQTITFSLNFSGASAQLLTLQRRAADASGQWNINTTGIASPTLNYLSVSNSNSTLCIVATNSTNGGGNTNWDFTGGGCGGGAPTAPTVLYLHETNAQSGDANPIKVSKSTFVHSSVYNDPDTGDVANKYQIIVYSNSGCTTVVWNSGDSGTSMTNCTEPNRCADITFGGSALFFNGIKYYWKMKYWDDTPTEGVFSGCTDNFTMLGPNDQMRHGNFSTRSGAKGKFVW